MVWKERHYVVTQQQGGIKLDLVLLVVEVMHVNQIQIFHFGVQEDPFWHSTHTAIDEDKLVMETAIKTIISSYAVRGFIVKVVLINI